MTRRLTTIALATGLCLGCSGKTEEGAGAPPSAKAPESAAPAAPASAPEARPPAPEGAKVRFAWPDAGSKVFPKFTAKFLAEQMTITPAGEAPHDHTKGHHHVLVDAGPMPDGTVIPADATHIHFGKGQTETELELAPGKHQLTLQLADGLHRSYGPKLSHTIEIEVVAPPEKAPRVFFAEPADGATVGSKVKMTFGLEGMTVRPAGEDPADKTTGHHHVVVDGSAAPIGAVVPADETHIHYGKGQTEAELELAPGKHTLTLQLADGAHRSYGPALSQTITIEVK